MKTFTLEDVYRVNPCYDPVTGKDRRGRVIHPGGFVGEDWEGTILDILEMERVPFEDRAWAAFMLMNGSDLLRIFAAKIIRELEQLNPPRLTGAADILEKHNEVDAIELTELRARAFRTSELPHLPVGPNTNPLVRSFVIHATAVSPDGWSFWRQCYLLGIEFADIGSWGLENVQDGWKKVVEILKEVVS